MRKAKQKWGAYVSKNEPKRPATALVKHGAYLLALLAILWFLARYIMPVIWTLIERI